MMIFQAESMAAAKAIVERDPLVQWLRALRAIRMVCCHRIIGLSYLVFKMGNSVRLTIEPFCLTSC